MRGRPPVAFQCMSESELIHLAADLSFVHTDARWRMPGSWQKYQYYGPDFYEEMARIASRGVMDMLFFGDAAETPENHGGSFDESLRQGFRWPKHDMMPMVPLMARVAPGVGFGLTMSTTYHHPFHVARLFASLDWITGGRVAWNSVTSAYRNEAANYGFKEMLPPAERYARAREHMKVVFGLWDSVEADALKIDRENGIFVDPGKVHFLDHEGEYYSVRGPLPALPSPQGRPMVIQAGQSTDGMDLAGTFADLQFVARKTTQSMAEHRVVLDANLAAHGRSPRDCGVLWPVRVIVDESRTAALEQRRRILDDLGPEMGLIQLSALYGIDFSKVEVDKPISHLLEMVRDGRGHFGSFSEIITSSDPNMTVREYARELFIDRPIVAGSPSDIADDFEEMHHAVGANGGFIISPGMRAPQYLRDFVELVVPELQRRGLSKTEYAGPTLRDNIG
jgi:FMN-dependent oxidoreductase (nitrilotriacetate monooxygenase family)